MLELQEQIAPLVTDKDNLEIQIIQEKRQADGLRVRATELRAERTIKEQKLHEMASKVKSKNQQVSSRPGVN